MSRTEAALQTKPQTDSPAPPAVIRRVLSSFDGSDAVVALGLLLWGVAFWPDTRLALGGPALVLVWYGLPPRPWFFGHGGPRKR